MKLKNMFAKPIERDIKGVIKVGQSDESNVRQELEEYVVTAELQKHFAEFFSNYSQSIGDNTDKIGVWISGFFGSGKSHFLKILSYLLENKIVDGKAAIDYFIDDDKISDQMVLADIKRSSSVATKVILFNIESKSEMNHADSDNAILAVFLKVFNEMQGYCSTNFHLSDLEKRLILTNKYEEYKKCFLDHYGEEWESARDHFNFIADVVVDVLSEIGFMTSESARNWCETAIGPYNCSIEDFTKLVGEYINEKGDNHRLVFLVDEMGQYIGSNTKLMLSLQTLVENLGTYCHGKAWIIVTSQEDIDQVTKVEGRNDFSKIQGRFDTRLSLSSANVDEVIKKRILKKNETATQTLTALYDSKSTAIKNLVVFTDTMELKLYSGGRDFASVYPFIPYQFKLLGQVLTEIRKHGASGKHLADGERSMLALFKESAVRIKEREQGELVPFNMFYDALENFLDHGHRSVITRALDNSKLNPDKNEECFEVNLLKTLFMIKYVTGVTANVDNLTSMMASHIDCDRLGLIEKVEKALKLLCEQMLVQRNGEIYIFLTDEEQEVNREINSQIVPTSEAVAKVSEIIFEQIYPEKRYKLPVMSNRYSFAFNQLVDDKPFKSNQNNDFGINILTPDWDGVRNKQVLTVMAKNNIIVLLPEDSSFLDEIRYGLKIEKYLRLSSLAKTLSQHEAIENAKKKEASECRVSAARYLEESLRNASIFVDGHELQASGKDVPSIFNEALNRLVTNMYSKLPYINVPKNEYDIKSVLNAKDKQRIIFGEGEKPDNHLALSDMLEYIRLKSSQHTRTSYKTLIDRFKKPPYGFVEDDIAWLVAYLFRSGDVSLFMNNEQVSVRNKKIEEVLGYLTKNAYVEKLLIEIRERATERQIKSVKDVMHSLFGSTEKDTSEDSILESFKQKAAELRSKLSGYRKEFEPEPRFPGRPIIDIGIELMDSISQVSFTTELFAMVERREDEYLDFAEDFDPIQIFFEGEQSKIFTKALRVMNLYNDSKNFIAGHSDIEMIVNDIKNIVKMPHPYGEIHKLPDLIANFTRLYDSILENEKVPLLEAMNSAKEHVLTILRSKNYIKIFEREFEKKFDEIRNKIYECHNISSLQSINSEIHILKINMLNRISQEEKRVAEEKLANLERVATDSTPKTPTLINVKKHRNVSIKNLDTGYSWRIESSEDIDKYIAQLRDNLMKELEQEENTIINIVF